jgi:hypothetical protein
VLRDGLQTFLTVVHGLAEERRISRFTFLARAGRTRQPPKRKEAR